MSTYTASIQVLSNDYTFWRFTNVSLCLLFFEKYPLLPNLLLIPILCHHSFPPSRTKLSEWSFWSRKNSSGSAPEHPWGHFCVAALRPWGPWGPWGSAQAPADAPGRFQYGKTSIQWVQCHKYLVSQCKLGWFLPGLPSWDPWATPNRATPKSYYPFKKEKLKSKKEKNSKIQSNNSKETRNLKKNKTKRTRFKKKLKKKKKFKKKQKK